METDAKLHIQELIRAGEIELCWSFVLDYENAANPFEEIRNSISQWRSIAIADCVLSDDVLDMAKQYMKLGLKQMDASHIACSIHLGTDFFLTTAKGILNKPITEISVLNPIAFIRRYGDEK